MTRRGEGMRKRNGTWIARWSAAALLGLAGLASASETQWWTIDSAADYAKAETHGVIVRPEGTLELGPATTTWTDDSLRTVWALAVLADGSVALAGDRGRIDRWTAAGGIRPWVRLGGGQVLSLAADGDGLLAGTGPRGLVYRIGARGDTSLVCRTGERYVWGLAAAGHGAWWAASGTRGRLLKLAAGHATIVFDSDESNLTALASDGHGGAYAGGDSHGRIYHTLEGGTTTTEFDASEDEIRSLALAGDGSLWAAALSVSATTDEPGDDDEKPAPVHGPVAGGRATVYRLVPDSAATAWWTSPQPLVYALAPTAEGMLAATGNRAGVYRIERVGGASTWLSPSPAQVTALAVDPRGGTWAATSNPVTLVRFGAGRASEGELLSASLDARHFSQFGRLRANARGNVRFETRSGNCDPPDSTWSPWRTVESDAGGARIGSPHARLLQWKAKLGSPDARVEDVAISWREQNLPPRIDDISVAQQAQGFRDGDIAVRNEAVTQNLPGGQKVEYSIALPANKAIRELPIWSRGLRTLQWHASDPNGDPLRFRVEIHNEDGGEWVEVGKDLEAMLFTWNTNTLPDGRYRVRVTASDAPGNAVGEERTAQIVSDPFIVDNTPPAISTLTGNGAHLEGVAEDAQGPVVRLELAVDDGDWRTLAPIGGMADAPRLRFTLEVPGLKPGEHLLSVRAIDQAGNAATRAVHVRVPPSR